MNSNSQSIAYTPLPEDWTVVEESQYANIFEPNEVVQRNRFSVNIATSPISTTNMSFTFFNETEPEENEVVINDPAFQAETLQENIDELKRSNDELLAENSSLRATSEGLVVENDKLRQEISELETQRIHKNHEIAALKLRVGSHGRVISRMQKGLFPHENQYNGRGNFLNGEQVFWRKASQCLWDEEVHGPVFGHGDHGCNFVMVQRCDPPRDSNEDTLNLVQAVGCHVNTGTFLKFRINDEDACFGF